MGRKIIDIPGSSIAIGLIACFYKTYSDSFFICQWTGVLALAGSFDLLTSFVLKTDREKPLNAALLGVLTNIMGMLVFFFAAFIIIQEPNWIAGGMEKVLNYAWMVVVPASVLSALLTTHIGMFIGSKINEFNSLPGRKFIPGIYLTTVLFLWIAASIN
jgi:hypothetical protein